jgi:phage N-6-adenine-methyltransferase
VSLVGYKAQNHRQQVGKRGALDKVDERRTPPSLLEPLDAEFGFTLDVAASAANAIKDDYYDRHVDGLTQPWHGVVWCNPPYSDVRPWVEKAWSETSAELVVMLLPANRTEQGWWQEMVEPFRDRADSPLRTEFLAGRLRFIAHDKDRVEPNERPPFGCVLLIWDRAPEAEEGDPQTPS